MICGEFCVEISAAHCFGVVKEQYLLSCLRGAVVGVDLVIFVCSFVALGLDVMFALFFNLHSFDMF